MTINFEMFIDSEIQAALKVAIEELGFSSRVIHRTPHDFSAVRCGEFRLKLADSSDVEKHPAWFSPLLEKER